MPAYTQLFFDAVGLNYPVEGFNPRLKCPSCKVPFEPKLKPVGATLPTTVNLNAAVTFTCPNCGSTIRLFVAIYQSATVPVKFRIQRSDAEGAGGIPADWWVKKP